MRFGADMETTPPKVVILCEDCEKAEARPGKKMCQPCADRHEGESEKGLSWCPTCERFSVYYLTEEHGERLTHCDGCGN